MEVTDQFYTGSGFIGYGSQWLIGQNNSPEDFVAVADVDRIKLGPMRAGIINKTHLRSPGRAHEKIATIRDVESFQMSGNLRLSHGSQNNAGGDGFTSGGLIALHRALEERNMKIVLSDTSPGTEIEFRGVISMLDLGELTLDGLTKFTCEVQPLADWTDGLP